MASVLRGFSPLLRTAISITKPRAVPIATPSICLQCRRTFAASSVQLSGHNKWSKIKHKKAAADKKTSKINSFWCKQLTLHSKRPSYLPVHPYLLWPKLIPEYLQSTAPTPT